MITIGQLFDQLAAEGLVSEAERERVAAAPADGDAAPWFVRLLIAFSAWLAAFTLLPLLANVLAASDSTAGAIRALVVGALFCGAAIGIRRWRPRSTFFGQLALALSLTGQSLVTGGVGLLTSDVTPTLLALIALECALIALYPDRLHRVLSTLAIAGALAFLAFDHDLDAAAHALVVLLAAGTIALLDREDDLDRELAWPIAVGGAIGLLGLLALALSAVESIELWWISGAGLTLLLVALELRILSGFGLPLDRGPALGLAAGTLILLIPSVSAPGIPAALIVLLLGFWRGSRFLIGLGALFLVVFVAWLYYSMQTTLLVKSLALGGAGLALLALRYGLLRWLFQPEVRQ